MAVLGLGALGSRHASIAATRVAGAKLVAAADPVEERRAAVAAAYGAATYANWEDALQHPGVDAVVVVTPSPTHAPAVIAAAKAGKAIFCEKPLAFTLEQCDEVASAVDTAGVLFQMGFMRRVDPAYAAAKQQIEAGVIGDVIAYSGSSRDPDAQPGPHWRTCGGIFMDSMSHDFDIARHLVGDEVVEVYAKGRILVYDWLAEYGDVDHAYVTLDFARGALGQIECSHNAGYGYDIRAEVMGTKGTLRIGYDRQTAVTLLTRAGVSHDHVTHWLDRFDNAYHRELQDFVDCIRSDRAPGCTIQDGRKATELGLAAGQSRRGGLPVKLTP